jgi:hypothetical protein
MGKQKLTEAIVRNIKKMLLEGELTHKEIAEKVNRSFRTNHRDKTKPLKTISREAITKINLGLKDEMDKNSRWSEVKLDEEEDDNG